METVSALEAHLAALQAPDELAPILHAIEANRRRKGEIWHEVQQLETECGELTTRAIEVAAADHRFDLRDVAEFLADLLGYQVEYCEEVLAEARYPRTPSKRSKRFPFSPRQQSERLSVNGGRCWMCGTADAGEVEHVKPLARGGWHMLANLRPACRSCNGRKHATWPVDTSTAAVRLDPARLP